MCALSSNVTPEMQQELQFHFYSPVVATDHLLRGVDNVRFDVALSPKFVKFCQGFVLQLIVKHSDAAQLLHNSPGAPEPAAKKEFRALLQDLLLTALNRAHTEKKPQLEILAQGTVCKFLILEVQAQYATVVAQGREKLKLFQRPIQERNPRKHRLEDRLSAFQTNKKIILRRVGYELLGLIDEVRGGPVRKTRESFFGSEASDVHAIFSNPLLFTEDGRNDYVNLEQYVMWGNYQKDPDCFEFVNAQVREFLEWADAHSKESELYHSHQEACAEITAQIEELYKQQEESTSRRGFFLRGLKPLTPVSDERLSRRIDVLQSRLEERMQTFRDVADTYAARLDAMVAAPENANLLVDFIRSEHEIAEARKTNASSAELAFLQHKAERQRQALETLQHQFFEAGLVYYILAAYETAKIYQDFCPPINPQQLKQALVNADARKKLEYLISEYRLPASAIETVEQSAAWVRNAGPREIQFTLLRLLRDYMRYHHDLRNFLALQKLLDQIHFPLEPKQRELSEINHTLYEFLLAEEDKQPKQGKISSHVILKADIRDSTSITAELFARELNPASYFSLNFFDPIHKLLPRFGASKVFLEGDAIILSMMETEGNSKEINSVARACCLAREMIEGVRAVNDRAARKNLPLVEIGIGISHQATAPMYLMDAERPIMISKALNESDRLSSCKKLAKQVLAKRNRFFNVFVMQLLPGEGSVSLSEEFLLHYNVEGIEINQPAFEKLCQELSMSKVELSFPLFGPPEPVELHCGTLPLGKSFQKIVVRKGRVPQLDPGDFHVVGYTDRHYYEVCSGRPLYDYVTRQLGW